MIAKATLAFAAVGTAGVGFISWFYVVVVFVITRERVELVVTAVVVALLLLEHVLVRCTAAAHSNILVVSMRSALARECPSGRNKISRISHRWQEALDREREAQGAGRCRVTELLRVVVAVVWMVCVRVLGMIGLGHGTLVLVLVMTVWIVLMGGRRM